MNKLANFGMGAVVAVLLLGPAGWADAREAVHVGVRLAAAIASPQAPSPATATTMVRSAIHPMH